MKRPRHSAAPGDHPGVCAADADAIVQIKVWLLDVSPMVWRRVLVSASGTLRELHGVIQVAMGWDGTHLFQFSLRATRYGASELSASSPDVTLAALQLRKGARFLYEYDLNIPWRHGIRIEDRFAPQNEAIYPTCSAGNGSCPPEDCEDPAGFTGRRDDPVSWDALEELGTLAEILDEVAIEDGPEVLDDGETRWRLEQALDQTQARERAQGRPFAKRSVNDRLRKGEHRELMHQH